MFERRKLPFYFVLLIGWIAVGLFAFWFFNPNNSICSGGIEEAIPSPDGRYIASIRYVDCGATTTKDIALSIIDSKTKNKTSLVFSSIARAEKVAVTWTSARTLRISNFAMSDLLQFNRIAASEISIEAIPNKD